MSKTKLTLRSGQLFGCLGQLFWLGLPFFVLAVRALTSRRGGLEAG